MAGNSGKMVGDLFYQLFDTKKIFWKVPNVLSFPDLVDYKVDSPVFDFANAVWKLELCPYGNTEYGTEGYIDVLLLRVNSQIPEHDVCITLIFKTRNERDFKSYSCSFAFHSEKLRSGVLKYLKNSTLKNKKKQLLPDESLTIEFHISTKKTPVIEIPSHIEITSLTPLSEAFSTLNKQISAHESKTLCDYREYYLQQEGCDVLLKVKGVEFSAHRAILSARSPVFASTFRSDMKEKATGVIDIEDCDPKIFSDFLCFLYCGEIDIIPDSVQGLFHAADKYDMPDLRKMCICFMKKHLSVDSFCNTIALALQYNETELIKLTARFFAKNIKEIIVTVKWQSFAIENPVYSNELIIKALVPDFDKKSVNL